MRQLGLRLTLDAAMLGVGGLMGIRVATSCLLGGVINYAILAPIMIKHGDIVQRTLPSGMVVPISRAEIVNQWGLWWGVTMMVIGSLVSLLGRPEIFTTAFKALRGNTPADSAAAGIAADPVYIDVSVPPGRRKVLPVETTHHAFAYVFAGDGKFCNASEPLAVPTDSVGWLDVTPPKDAGNRSLVLFDRGDEVVVQAGENGIRFLLVSGKPLQEPVAWYGPIVMNTQQQLQQAFVDLEKGTFLKTEKLK